MYMWAVAAHSGRTANGRQVRFLPRVPVVEAEALLDTGSIACALDVVGMGGVRGVDGVAGVLVLTDARDYVAGQRPAAVAEEALE